MASTNKTPHLQLNQWVLSDPLLMEDLNSDNTKIDTAYGENPWVKIMDIVTEQPASTLELDLSGLDLTKYLSLEVFFSSPDPQEYRYWNVNGITDYMKYQGSYNGSWSTNATPFLFGSEFTIDLAARYIQINTPARAFSMAEAGVNVSNLVSLQLFNSSPQSNPLQTGTIVKIRGRKNDY